MIKFHQAQVKNVLDNHTARVNKSTYSESFYHGNFTRLRGKITKNWDAAILRMNLERWKEKKQEFKAPELK